MVFEKVKKIIVDQLGVDENIITMESSFIDTLGADIGMQNLLSYDFREETKEYICSKTTGPLINSILSEVERTKKVSHSNAKARMDAAKKLIKNTKDDIIALKDILKESDPQYQILADKLGLHILIQILN